MFKKIVFVLIIISFICAPFSFAKTPYSSKPLLGSQIDWSHPLAKGLVGCWLMNEGGGSVINDLVKRHKANMTNSFWVVKTKGISTSFNGSSSKILNRGFLTPNADFTCFVLANVNSIASISSNLVSSYNADATGKGWSLNAETYNNSGKFGFTFLGIADYISATNTITNRDVSLAIVHRDTANKVDFYVNNTMETINVGNIAPVTHDGISFGYRERGTGGASSFLDGNIYLVYIYNRALSPSEIQQLYQDPYCFIKPQGVWSSFSSAVSSFGAKLYQGSVKLLGSVSN